MKTRGVSVRRTRSAISRRRDLILCRSLAHRRKDERASGRQKNGLAHCDSSVCELDTIVSCGSFHVRAPRAIKTEHRGGGTHLNTEQRAHAFACLRCSVSLSSPSKFWGHSGQTKARRGKKVTAKKSHQVGTRWRAEALKQARERDWERERERERALVSSNHRHETFGSRGTSWNFLVPSPASAQFLIN